MAVLVLTDDEIALRDLASVGTLLIGRELAADGMVTRVRADLGTGLITATVREGSEARAVVLSVRRRPDGQLDRLEGTCTCGRAVPCPHAVAVVLHGRFPRPARPTLSVVSADPASPASSGPVEIPAAPAPWELALTSVLADPPTTGRRREAPPAPTASPTADQPPIALQFDLTDTPGARVTLRLVVPSRTGAWVRTGVSWRDLNYTQYSLRSVPPAQVRLLKELKGLADPQSTGYYGYDNGPLRLDAIGSRRVWDLLLEAQELGLPLVRTGRKAAAVLVHAAPATAVLDVRRQADELVAVPVLSVAGQPVHRWAELGDPPHGIVWSPASPDDAGLSLARLSAPPPQLFARLADNGPLRVPAADEQRFLDTFYPELARHLPVVCRDGSVGLPAAAPPRLALAVTAHGGHQVTLAWSWTYVLGTTRRSEPLAIPGGPSTGTTDHGRDAAAEHRLLDQVVPALTPFDGLLEPSPHGARPATGARLEGVETARFMAEALPRIQALPDLDVQVQVVSGDDAPLYHEVDAAPVIRFAADDPGSGPASQPGTQDWFDLSVTVTVDDQPVPFAELFVALAQDAGTLLLDNGTYFSLDRPEFARLAELIAESRDLLDAPPGTVRLNRFHSALWDDLEQLGEITGQVDVWRASVRGLAEAAQPTDRKPPAGLQATLRPYQKEGFDWLAALFDLRLGGLLADDMGLGKTLQTLTLVLHAREQGLSDLPFLVVAPTSVVSNWESEAHRFAPDLTVAAISQTQARRGHDLATAVAGADLVITSYTLFRLEFEQYRARAWAGLVLDEAQNVKNHQSAGYRCARKLPAEFKLAVTGTPMENNLMELWSLLSITAPGLFPRADRFTEHYRTPIERDRDADRLARLRSRISPLMLRRTKEHVAPDLPDRQEQVVELELNSRHRALYAKYLQRERQKVLGLLGDLNRNRFEIFRSLTLLRQLSLDPSLVDPQYANISSTKLDALLEQLVDIVAEGHRVLVFSQFTRFLARARARLVAAGIDHCYLDGTTRNRPQVISQFRTGTAPVFLISLKAGGTGLTLTEADYVVLLDPWWNPATEAQAVDRVHRIGQTRKVMVYRMVAKDTIEEKVMALKERKAALTASVLAGDDFASAALTADDIRNLLG